MKKVIGLLACMILMVSVIYAQQTIRVKVTNQYEMPVTNVTVVNSNDTKEYTTDKTGYTVITVTDPSAPVTFQSPNYESVPVSLTTGNTEQSVLMHKAFTWKDLLNPMFYIVNGGLWLLLFIVFAETGLFIGFFLPGDSLLFVAGIYSNNLGYEFLKLFGLGHLQNEWIDLGLLVVLVSLMGILGNMVGYWFGRKIGPAMYNWKDRFLFKKKYLYDAHDFYEKHGGGAIIFARFLPIIRTFAPIIAGIVQMEKKKFMLYNIIGCVAWVFSMIFAGHFLQVWVRNQFGFELKEHLEVIVIIIVAVTTLPVLYKIVFGKKKEPAQAK